MLLVEVIGQPAALKEAIDPKEVHALESWKPSCVELAILKSLFWDFFSADFG